MKSHLCTNGKWEEGTVRDCKKGHGRNLKNAQRVIMRDGGRADRAAGVVGHDSGQGFYREGNEK